MLDFQELDPGAIREFIRSHPLGMITAQGGQGLVATHVPLLVRGEGPVSRLRGHVMRKTPYWEAFGSAPEVLVAFTGPDAPILGSWIEEQPYGGTWNYMAVHLKGKLRYLPQEDLIDILRELKDTYEVDPSHKFEHLAPDYVPSMIRAIEGFEIEVTSVQAVFKLSQNRSESDFERTIEALRQRGGEHALVAEEMSARRSLYFGS